MFEDSASVKTRKKIGKALAGGRTKLLNNMIILLEDKEGKRHPIEAVVIAAHSSLIRNILKNEGVKEQLLVPSSDGELVAIRIDKVINLPIEGAVLDKIISFVKDGSLDLELDFICDLLVASEYLDMRALSRIIISWLSQELNFLNVLSFLSFSQEFMIPELEDQCRKLINTFQT